MDRNGQSKDLKISVVIPVYNDPESLELCLQALKKQTLHQNQFEVIVVNNGQVGSIKRGEEWASNVTCCHEPIPGSYAARNRGATVARGKMLAFTDADCIPDPGWLEQAMNCFSQTGCDMIGGAIDLFKRDRGSNLAYIYERHHLFTQKTNVEQGVSVTANFFIKREAFEEADGFNASIKSMGDMEFTGRCTENGLSLVYSGAAKVRHPARATVSEVMKRRRRIVCWKTIHSGLAGRGKRIRLMRLALIRVFFGVRHFLKKKPKNGKLQDMVRLKWMIAIVTVYELFVRLTIAAGFIDPNEVRQ